MTTPSYLVLCREESSLVDIFVMEMLVCVMNSLKLAHKDPKSLGMSSKRVLYVYIGMRRVQPRWPPECTVNSGQSAAMLGGEFGQIEHLWWNIQIIVTYVCTRMSLCTETMIYNYRSLIGIQPARGERRKEKKNGNCGAQTQGV